MAGTIDIARWPDFSAPLEMTKEEDASLEIARGALPCTRNDIGKIA
jgi:hypothetical protein